VEREPSRIRRGLTRAIGRSRLGHFWAFASDGKALQSALEAMGGRIHRRERRRRERQAAEDKGRGRGRL